MQRHRFRCVMLFQAEHEAGTAGAPLAPKPRPSLRGHRLASGRRATRWAAQRTARPKPTTYPPGLGSPEAAQGESTARAGTRTDRSGHHVSRGEAGAGEAGSQIDRRLCGTRPVDQLFEAALKDGQHHQSHRQQRRFPTPTEQPENQDRGRADAQHHPGGGDRADTLRHGRAGERLVLRPADNALVGGQGVVLGRQDRQRYRKAQQREPGSRNGEAPACCHGRTII